MVLFDSNPSLLGTEIVLLNDLISRNHLKPLRSLSASVLGSSNLPKCNYNETYSQARSPAMHSSKSKSYMIRHIIRKAFRLYAYISTSESNDSNTCQISEFHFVIKISPDLPFATSGSISISHACFWMCQVCCFQHLL